MRILFLTHEFPPFPGGVATYCGELARAARGLGHEVTVVAPDFGHRGADEAAELDGVELRRFRGGTYSWRDLLPMLLRLGALLPSGGYDMIHAGDWPFAMALAFVNRFRRVPFVATVYGTDLLGIHDALQLRCLGVRDTFERAERVFAISEFTRQLLFRVQPGIDPARVRVTPLGVDGFWFGPADGLDGLASRLGIGAGRKVVLTVGRLDRRKGHSLVLEALTRLPADRKARLAYVVAGKETEPGYAAALRELAARSGVPVVFTGPVSREDLRRLYALADLFCMPGEAHPKKVEGFGLVYLEAAAQGLPSVACDLAAIPEVVRDGETGIVVPPGDAVALAAAIQRLLDEPGKLSELGNAARRRAERYDWRTCAERTYGEAKTYAGPARSRGYSMGDWSKAS